MYKGAIRKPWRIMRWIKYIIFWAELPGRESPENRAVAFSRCSLMLAGLRPSSLASHQHAGGERRIHELPDDGPEPYFTVEKPIELHSIYDILVYAPGW